jgi:hypothetical protein
LNLRRRNHQRSDTSNAAPNETKRNLPQPSHHEAVSLRE